MSINSLPKCWDIVVVGGGITGAGIFREAVRMGLQTLLLEQKDFAWGTSSRSSKMVHGGLRYLKQGQILLTRTSVIERQRLLREAPGLVEPLEFLTPVFKEQSPGFFMMGAGLAIYSLLAGSIQHRYYSKNDFLKRVPFLRSKSLKGGYSFWDAGVDDARLVLRLINEGQDQKRLNHKINLNIRAGNSNISVVNSNNSEDNGKALNYTKVKRVLRDEQGFVKGVLIEDTFSGEERIIETSVVINASGAWASNLHPSSDPKLHLRPLRGSHLIFPHFRLPIGQVISFIHPEDRRPVFIFPWEGATFLGTTDVDHKNLTIDQEPVISKDEVLYLMEGFKWAFPDVNLSINDSIASIAGIRPVLSSGKLKPSEESREHVVWKDKGLVTVTGGKLTTFRKLAVDTLNAAQTFMRVKKSPMVDVPIFDLYSGECSNVNSKLGYGSNYNLGYDTHSGDNYNNSGIPSCPRCDLSIKWWRRLYGRYGSRALEIIQNSKREDLTQIPQTNYLWAELPYAAANEQVHTLDDLLMRRVRIGLILPRGGEEHFSRIKKLCQHVLGWDDHHFNQEIIRYRELWQRAYSVPK
ncbi:MAG: glycerol-3-phosphate dehydrogenase/oxidase [Desulfamplus sp.]|nr:glycerol-3-phosphate dehydrogenase/oxidase [Desulfamplus sp.]